MAEIASIFIRIVCSLIKMMRLSLFLRDGSMIYPCSGPARGGIPASRGTVSRPKATTPAHRRIKTAAHIGMIPVSVVVCPIRPFHPKKGAYYLSPMPFALAEASMYRWPHVFMDGRIYK